MKTAGQKFAEAQALLGKLEDMKNRPYRYASRDQIDWMEKDLPKLSELLDELEYDVSPYVKTRYSKPDVYSQAELNHELREAVEQEIAV